MYSSSLGAPHAKNLIAAIHQAAAGKPIGRTVIKHHHPDHI